MIDKSRESGESKQSFDSPDSLDSIDSLDSLDSLDLLLFRRRCALEDVADAIHVALLRCGAGCLLDDARP